MNVTEIKAIFDDGNSITTKINTDEAGARAYYALGSEFNLGCGGQDNIRTVTAVEILSTSATQINQEEKV